MKRGGIPLCFCLSAAVLIGVRSPLPRFVRGGGPASAGDPEPAGAKWVGTPLSPCLRSGFPRPGLLVKAGFFPEHVVQLSHAGAPGTVRGPCGKGTSDRIPRRPAMPCRRKVPCDVPKCRRGNAGLRPRIQTRNLPRCRIESRVGRQCLAGERCISMSRNAGVATPAYGHGSRPGFAAVSHRIPRRPEMRCRRKVPSDVLKCRRGNAGLRSWIQTRNLPGVASKPPVGRQCVAGVRC